MNLIFTTAKSFLSLFAMMRLFSMRTTNPLSVILFLMLFYLFGRLSDMETKLEKPDQVLAGICSLLFSALTLAATYSVLYGSLTSGLFHIIILLLSFCGFFLLYYYLVLWILYLCADLRIATTLYPVTWLPFLAFFGCLLAWLPYFLHAYPGTMTPDSINQYAQVIGAYELSNHHSVIHTLLIGFFYQLGMQISGDVTFSLALYTLFQMWFMAFTAAYVVRTLQKAGVITPICIAVICFYAFMPYHGAYAVTMWKDILFAGSMTLFTASLLRFMLRSSRTPLAVSEYITLLFPYIVSGFLVCLLRTNGWYAFLVTLPFLLFTLRGSLKIMIPANLVLLALVLFVKYPCMNIYEIKQADFAESLSIPLQQIARVAANQESLTAEQVTQLNQFLDSELLASAYQPDVSDPIKNLVREHGVSYLEAHKQEFFSLWLAIGMDHPKAYFDAFVAQTNGFWYPDVSYEVGLAEGIYPNEFGLTWQPILRGSLIVKLKEIMFKLWELIPLYGFLWSMGGILWLLLITVVVSLRIQRPANVLPVFPALALVATLCLATPVATEFRYAYALFYGLPLYLLLPFLSLKTGSVSS